MSDARPAIVRYARVAFASFSAIRLLPHIGLLLLGRDRGLAWSDLYRYADLYETPTPSSPFERTTLFIRMMTFYPEYRNVFYFRYEVLGRFLAFLCPPMPSLRLYVKGKCGPGLCVHHGFGTTVTAEEIGANFTIRQLASVGFVNNSIDCPTIGDNVTIGAGARVLGAVRLGDDVVVGANSVVISDVPSGVTVMGVPARTIAPNVPSRPVGVPKSPAVTTGELSSRLAPEKDAVAPGPSPGPFAAPTNARRAFEHPGRRTVSVIIPTLHRPVLLQRALASVLRQTWRDLEVIVVVDGPDPDTIAVLRTIDDPRLRVIANERPLTAAGARNAGLDRATGEWIAFLDDDDEWAPDKLDKQLAYAADCGPALITCQSRVLTPTASVVRPKVAYDNRLPIDDYLFDRPSPFEDPGFIQTSSYLLPRALCERIRFSTDTPHDDWDFLLRLSKQHGVRVETTPEILVTVHADDARPSLSRSGTWQGSLEWADRIRPLLTHRAYAGFCLSAVGARAARERAYSAALPILYRAFKSGVPRPWRVAAFCGLWFLPRSA